MTSQTGLTASQASAVLVSGQGWFEGDERWARRLADAVFALLDTDESGSISVDELVKAMRFGKEASAARRAALLFVALDTEPKDGRLTVAELAAGIQSAGSGDKTIKQLLAIVHVLETTAAATDVLARGQGWFESDEHWAVRLAEAAFVLLDTDHSGSISVDELVKAMRFGPDRMAASQALELFAALDGDDDHRLEVEELRDGLLKAGRGHASVQVLLAIVQCLKGSGSRATSPTDQYGLHYLRPTPRSLRGPHQPKPKGSQLSPRPSPQSKASIFRRGKGSAEKFAAEMAYLEPMTENQRMYTEAMQAYQSVQKEQRQKYLEFVDADRAWKRKGLPAKRAKERREITVARLKSVTQQLAAEEAAALEEKNRKLADQEREFQWRMRKQEEQERRTRREQAQIAHEIALERAKKEEEDARAAKHAEELLVMSRKAKAESEARKAKQEAALKAVEDAEIKARFKASEAERTRREAEKKAADRAFQKKQEAAFRKKMEEEMKAQSKDAGKLSFVYST